MGSVTIMCPRTGQQVNTGIEMSKFEFDAMPNIQATMRCWACGGDHSWSKRWATYVEGHVPAPDIDLSAAEAVRRRELYRAR